LLRMGVGGFWEKAKICILLSKVIFLQ